MQIQASKIVHKNESRIKVDFPFNNEIAYKLKQIPDAKWSKTHKAWHIPYSNTAFVQLKNLFPEIEYPQKKIISSINTKSIHEVCIINNETLITQKQRNVSIMVFGRSIAIKLPKNEIDTRFLANLKYSRWDTKQFCWIVPNYLGNLDLLKDFFKERITELVIHEEFEITDKNNIPRKICRDDLLIIKTKSGRLKLIFGFKEELTKAIKKIPFNNWDKQNKWWSIPFSERFLKEIKDIAIAQKQTIIYEEEEVAKNKKSRISPFDISNYRKCPDEYILKLKELRYSELTIKTYKGLFEEFINFYNKVEKICDIDESMITAFLRYLVIERKVSSSYQNQAINSVKFYYERVLGGQRKIYLVDRPREEKKLPIVLNENEIASLFKAVENIKHKAILMLAYSGGLRLSELINVKLKDIDSNRMQIRIEQAKGKKDRYTLLSVKLLEILRNYFKLYKPKQWLFEGANGRQYAARSIQLIMQDATKKADIKKKVSVHSLRHSFATHLLENGTDLRYIQSLLGHESSKTTEIYTHITTKGFDQIKSPLDKLNL